MLAVRLGQGAEPPGQGGGRESGQHEHQPPRQHVSHDAGADRCQGGAEGHARPSAAPRRAAARRPGPCRRGRSGRPGRRRRRSRRRARGRRRAAARSTRPRPSRPSRCRRAAGVNRMVAHPADPVGDQAPHRLREPVDEEVGARGAHHVPERDAEVGGDGDKHRWHREPVERRDERRGLQQPDRCRTVLSGRRQSPESSRERGVHDVVAVDHCGQVASSQARPGSPGKGGRRPRPAPGPRRGCACARRSGGRGRRRDRGGGLPRRVRRRPARRSRTPTTVRSARPRVRRAVPSCWSPDDSDDGPEVRREVVGHAGEPDAPHLLGEQLVARVQHRGVALAGEQGLQPLRGRPERHQLVVVAAHTEPVGEGVERQGEARSAARRRRPWRRGGPPR